MSGSRTIIEDDEWLGNVHPGEILRHDFLIGGEIPIAEAAQGSGIAAELLADLLEAKGRIDAAVDLRLGRYFGMSEGFFLRLQNHYDLEQERRAHGEELARIVRRAA